MKELFYKYQKQLLWIANTNFGKDILDIPYDGIVGLLEPSAVHYVNRGVVKARFYTGQVFGKKIYPILKMFESINNLRITMNPDFLANVLNNMGTPTLPLIAGVTNSFYSDTYPGDSSVCGYIYDEGGGTTDWYTLHDAATAPTASPTHGTLFPMNQRNSGTLGRFGRSWMIFDTQSLSGALSISGNCQITCSSKTYSGELSPANFSLVGSNPASNTAIVAGDWDTLGTTLYATALAESSVSAGSANNLTLNASGLAAISTTGGVSKFGYTTEYDRTRTRPSTDGRMGYFAYGTGGTSLQNVQLVLTYIPANKSLFFAQY